MPCLSKPVSFLIAKAGVTSSFRKYVIPFFVHVNVRLFSFLKRKYWLKRRQLILVRLSLIKMRALGGSLLWARNRCRLLKTDRQTTLVYFAWPTKRPGNHQSQLTIIRDDCISDYSWSKPCNDGRLPITFRGWRQFVWNTDIFGRQVYVQKLENTYY